MKKTVIIVGVLVVAIAGTLMYLLSWAKSKSPEDGTVFNDNDLSIYVYYNRPFKKGRVIFAEDGLAPYGKVWRTGANEATYIQTNKTLVFKGKELPAGKYSIWTIPNEQTWTVIFNAEYPLWGINYNGESNRNPAADVVTVDAPVLSQETVIEQFTISIERVDETMELIFLWDKTIVAVPFTVTGQ